VTTIRTVTVAYTSNGHAITSTYSVARLPEAFAEVRTAMTNPGTTSMAVTTDDGDNVRELLADLVAETGASHPRCIRALAATGDTHDAAHRIDAGDFQ
jgi:hypothetical protein